MLNIISGFSTKEISSSLHALQLWVSKMSINAPQSKNHPELRTNDLYQLLVVLYLCHLCPWNSSGKNTGASSSSLLQGIFSTWGSNLGLLHCRQILYCLSHQRGPIYGKSMLNGRGWWIGLLNLIKLLLSFWDYLHVLFMQYLIIDKNIE